MKSLPILSIITWLPTLGALIILVLFKKDQSDQIKKFATAWFGVAFVASLALLKYDSALGGMQFLEDHQWVPVIGARYQMGADGVAVLLIVLTTLLGVIAALSSWKYIEKREKEYYVLLLLLQTAVVGVFTSMDLFLFYLFFEVSLVPMYFLIGIWGGENRLYAAIKFFLYTLVGSVVMLLGVLKIYFLTQDTALTGRITQATIDLLAGNQQASAMVSSTLQAAAQNGTGSFNILYLQALGSVMPMGAMQVLLFFTFALGFAIKVPMFPFHTWLPDAHVEAPTAGSVILAGILLKLGTYGFYRFNIPMFPAASADESYFFAGTNHQFGVRSVMIFLAIVGIIYDRRHTRNVAEFGGLSHVMPGYAAVFLSMVMTAIGLPLLCVFISEFLSLRGAFEANPMWAAWGSLGIILNAGYMLWLYQRMFFGTIDNPKNEKLFDLSTREWIYMTPLVIMSLWIGIYPKAFLSYIERPVNAVVRQVRPTYPIPGMPPGVDVQQRAAVGK